MQIAGLVKTSLVDYPGKLAACVFTQGCNFDCYFCHNRGLIAPGQGQMDAAEVLQFLQKRRSVLEGVVVSGGEPTLQADLADFLREVKTMGYAVKLDTNGGNPAVLQALLREKLVDYVAMDVKAPWEKYPQIAGRAATEVQQCLQLLRSATVGYELRTTFLPELTEDDILDIALQIAPVQRYALQGYRVPAQYPAGAADKVQLPAHDAQAFARAQNMAQACGGEVLIRQ